MIILTVVVTNDNVNYYVINHFVNYDVISTVSCIDNILTDDNWYHCCVDITSMN